jgi:5'-nucleotidase
VEGSDVAFPGQDIRMTFVHTTDSHSKVLPFKYVPSMTDEKLGIVPCAGTSQLDDCQIDLDYQLQDYPDQTPNPTRSSDCMAFLRAESVCPECLEETPDIEVCSACVREIRSSQRCTNYAFGGAARTAYAANQERKSAIRFAHVDTGDFFQGAPIFNLFNGEAEIRSLSAMGIDATVIGNHEFDKGVDNLAVLLYKFATFPLLNANFMWEATNEPGSNQLGDLVEPFFVKDYAGLRIGYIGMGNIVSLNSLGNADNSMGVRALDTYQVLNEYVPMIRDQVDLVVILSHLGVHGDVMVARNIPGIDIVFGGHDHVVLNPPLEIVNEISGETTLVVHSGVNYKALGRLDVVVRDGKILAHDYKVIPIVGYTDPEQEGYFPEDPLLANLLYDYEFELSRAQDLNREIGVAHSDFPRYAVGDSPLGNLVADAMRARKRVETDFAVTNTLGIRADLDKGPVTVGKMYEIFPFENTITTMYMSGPELQQLFDYIAGRTAAYGCSPQVQVSGVRTVMDCTKGRVKDLEINGVVIVKDYNLVEPFIVLSMATNDYIANGGSGFDILEQNTTKSDTMLSLRDVVIDYIESAPCIYTTQTSGGSCPDGSDGQDACICPMGGRISLIK